MKDFNMPRICSSCDKLATIDCAACRKDYCTDHGTDTHILYGHETSYIENAMNNAEPFIDPTDLPVFGE